jgi:hypothetical protein
METTIRVRMGELEVECAGEEEFLLERFPVLVSDLVDRLGGCEPSTVSIASRGGTSVAEPMLASVVGVVRDYWTNDPVPSAQIRIVGLNPELVAQSDEAGRFVLSGRIEDDPFVIAVGGPAGYIETLMPVERATGPITRDVFVVARADVARQSVLLGRASDPDTASIFVHLLDASGGPLEMVPGTNLSLETLGAYGPYFFGPDGEVQPQASVSLSRAFDGRSRAAFFNVAAGVTRMSVVAVSDGALVLSQFQFLAAAAGATILEAKLSPA